MLLDTIELPDSLRWEDEMDWSPIVQSVGYGASGALFIQEGVKAKGREITLVGTSELGWINRTTVESLIALRNTSGWSGTLILPDEREFTVRFRNSDKAVDVTPIIPYNQYEATGMYQVNAIRLMEV